MKIPRCTGRDADDPNWSEIEQLANSQFCGALLTCATSAKRWLTHRQEIEELDAPPLDS